MDNSSILCSADIDMDSGHNTDKNLRKKIHYSLFEIYTLHPCLIFFVHYQKLLRGIKQIQNLNVISVSTFK